MDRHSLRTFRGTVQSHSYCQSSERGKDLFASKREDDEHFSGDPWTKFKLEILNRRSKPGLVLLLPDRCTNTGTWTSLGRTIETHFANSPASKNDLSSRTSWARPIPSSAPPSTSKAFLEHAEHPCSSSQLGDRWSESAYLQTRGDENGS
jgi:hypothetical protein